MTKKNHSSAKDLCWAVQRRSCYLLACGILLTPVWACGGSANGAEAVQIARVEPEGVCMFMNEAFEGEGTLVEIDGKSYRAFSKGCEENLRKIPATRKAVDPVTGNPVDKADAVIGTRLDGTVLYFESEETFQKFASGESKDEGS